LKPSSVSPNKVREWLAIQQRKGGPALEVLEKWAAELGSVRTSLFPPMPRGFYELLMEDSESERALTRPIFDESAYIELDYGVHFSEDDYIPERGRPKKEYLKLNPQPKGPRK